MIFKPISGLIAKIPVIGKPIAPYVAPIAFGALGLYGVHLAYKFLGRWIPPQVKGWIAPVGYTVGGVVLGLVTAMLPLARADKTALAAAMITGGAAVDAFRYVTGSTALGDGGLWQLGNEGMLDAVALGSTDPDAQAIAAMYSDAMPADAQYAGDDFDAIEGNAILSGPRTWRQRFQTVRREVRTVGPCSKHARQHGHRWGWLCRFVGWDSFQKIAQLQQDQRKAYIHQLKAHAIASIPAQLAAEQAQAAATAGAYGALLYAGG